MSCLVGLILVASSMDPGLAITSCELAFLFFLGILHAITSNRDHKQELSSMMCWLFSWSWNEVLKRHGKNVFLETSRIQMTMIQFARVAEMIEMVDDADQLPDNCRQPLQIAASNTIEFDKAAHSHVFGLILRFTSDNHLYLWPVAKYASHFTSSAHATDLFDVDPAISLFFRSS